MKNNFSLIKIEDIDLWAHVGVFDTEREYGQLFRLKCWIKIDTKLSSENDDISQTLDYSILIKEVKKLSRSIVCETIEHFSEEILILFNRLFGSISVKIKLTKMAPPVDGFSGMVSITKSRNFSL